MNTKKFIYLITIAGQGLSFGLGTAALLFGLLFVYMSLKDGQGFSITLLLPIFSGLFLVYVGIKSVNHAVE